MCGILGMALKNTNGALSSEADFFEELLYVDALRGDDSTGVACLYNDGEMQVIKEASPADYFRNSVEFGKLKNKFVSKGKAIIGHNRKKTMGKIEDATAHPFIIRDRHAFIHNGTLYNHEKLYKTDVDSEALGMHLTECEGDKEKLEKALGEVHGAYACAWIDQEKEILYLLKNSQRTLFIATTSAGYFFCSEFGFLMAIANRNKIKLDSIDAVEDDTLYRIELGKGTVDLTKEKLEIKKSTAPSHHGAFKKNGGTAATKQAMFRTDGYISKQVFKKIRQNLLGSSLCFWMDDYVESNTHPECKDWLIWGESTEIEFNHVIKGYIEAPLAKLKSMYDEKFLSGKITEVSFNKEDMQLDIYVKDILPVLGSYESTNSITH